MASMILQQRRKYTPGTVPLTLTKYVQNLMGQHIKFTPNRGELIQLQHRKGTYHIPEFCWTLTRLLCAITECLNSETACVFFCFGRATSTAWRRALAALSACPVCKLWKEPVNIEYSVAIPLRKVVECKIDTLISIKHGLMIKTHSITLPQFTKRI